MGNVQSTGFAKSVVFINAAVPLALLVWDVGHRNVGANPVEFVTRTTGMLTLIFLFLTLAVTPVRKITGINSVIKYRRMLGLYAFFYGCLHLLTYVWFDRSLNFGSAITDIGQRPFIAVGMVAFFLMVPLAVTSTNKMIKRLGGKRWSRLHRIVYISGMAGVLHFWMLVKSDTRLPLTFAFILLLLLGYRVFVRSVPQNVPRATLFPQE